MSDLLFSFESHLNSHQTFALQAIQSAAAAAGMKLYLVGGALRDMIVGFPIRDLDFVVEGNAVQLAKALVKQAGAELSASDPKRNCADLIFPNKVYVSIAMAKEEVYAKSGAKPTIKAATIYEDLNTRDFTVNAVAMSLNTASRGLIIDPTNGLGDLARKEMRTVGKYTLYDDPVRILRLIRLSKRFGFAIDERTQSQYENVRLANLEKKIPAEGLHAELLEIAQEPNCADIIQELDAQQLLVLFCPSLTGAKVNHEGLQKLQRTRQSVPADLNYEVDYVGPFLQTLCEKLNPKEKAALKKATVLDKESIAAWEKLEAKAKKLEALLKSAKLNKPSLVYNALVNAPGAEVIYLAYKSKERVVQDRIKNFLQRYLFTAQEITEEELLELGLKDGSPKFAKAKAALITKRLDARPKKAPEPPPPPPTPQHPPLVVSARRSFPQAAAKG